MDWCRAEPLKLATCSDDETVRTWTIDPLRVSHQAASRQPSSSSFSSSIARGPIGSGESLGPAEAGGARSWWPYVVPGSTARQGEGPSGEHHSFGGGSAGPGSVPMGKFGLGTARAGESFWRRRGGTAKALFGYSSGGGNSDHVRRRRKIAEGGGPGGQGWQRALGSQGRGVADNSMALFPRPTSTVVASAVSPARTNGPSGIGRGQVVVLSPRSRNKRAAEAARTPVPYSRAEATAVGARGSGGTPGSARGFHIGRHISSTSTSSSSGSSSAPSQGKTTRTHADENSVPGGPQHPGVAAAGISIPPEEAATDSETWGAQSLDGDMDVAGVVLVGDESAVAGDSKTGSRSPLDGLPRGWSAAARTRKGSRVAERRQQPQGEEQEKRQKRQKQEQMDKQKGLQKGTRGAASGGSSRVHLKNQTLMACWERSQARLSRDVHGKAAAD